MASAVSLHNCVGISCLENNTVLWDSQEKVWWHFLLSVASFPSAVITGGIFQVMWIQHAFSSLDQYMTSTSHGCDISISKVYLTSNIISPITNLPSFHELVFCFCVKLRVQTEMSGLMSGKVLASTYRLRSPLDGLPQISEFQTE